MKHKVAKIFVALAMVAALLAVAVGCGSSGGGSTTAATTAAPAETTAAPAETTAAPAETEAPAESGGKKIAFTVQSLGNDFVVAITGAIGAALEAQGCTMQVDSADGNVTKQIEQIENYAQMGYDAIVIWPVNADGISATVQRVEEMGVQVLGFTTEIEGATGCMVAADEYTMGEAEGALAGKWIDETFPDAGDGEIKVLFMESTSSPEAVSRSEGTQTIIANNSKINPIIVQCDWNDQVGARNIIENALNVDPDIKAIVAINGTTALAGNSYVMSGTSPIEDKSQFAIFAIDETDEIDAAIRSSVNNESVLRGTVSMGTIADTVNDFMKAMQPFIDGGDIQPVYGSAFEVTPETLQ